MSESPVDPTVAVAYGRADAQLRAALAIVDDASTEPDTACVHLVRGLSALAELSEQDEAEVGPRLAAEAPRWGVDGDALLAVWTAVDAHESDANTASESTSRKTWLSHAEVLASAVRGAEKVLYGDRLTKAQRGRWVRRAIIATAVVVPAIVALVLTMPTYREGQWRGAYFGTRDFTGEPHVRRDGDVRFSWDESPPIRDMPEDGFSVRWDTCMVLDESLNIAFRLTSDDGSRLYVDDRRVVNNWGTHGDRSRGARVALEPGVHHLRVEYFDHKRDASVSLVASLRGERPHQLPVRILHYPGDDLDLEDPCADVRGGN